MQSFYTTLLNLCNTEKAISKGEFYDLTYSNLEGCAFNEHKQYTFIRKYENEVLLIVVNFDESPVQVGINIPQHAFDFLNIPQAEECKSIDLLSDSKETICFTTNKLTQIKLDGCSGKILKIKI